MDRFMYLSVIGPYYLRAQATFSSNKIKLLKPSDTLKKLSESQEWTKVQIVDNQADVGFVPLSMARIKHLPVARDKNNKYEINQISNVKTATIVESIADKPNQEPQSRARPPWMEIAESELRKNIRETGEPPNPEILKFFHSTSWENPGFEAPWCAAFVSYCMENCSNQYVNGKNIKSARAADWVKWGAPLKTPRYGALAILYPLSSGTSGHVGFVSSFEDTQTELLGGNQEDALTKRFFSTNKILQYRWLNWEDTDSIPNPKFSPSPLNQPNSIFNESYNAHFRSLVPHGFFSSDPDDLNVRRSVRTNNPGALNISNWQKSFAGFVGLTPEDRAGNRTSIYVTPEHGVAAWYKLLTEIYGYGTNEKFSLSELAIRYSGADSRHDKAVDNYLKAWSYWSNGDLRDSSTIFFGDFDQLLMLAKSMFAHEAGFPTPLLESQISEGIKLYRSGLLPRI